MQKMRHRGLWPCVGMCLRHISFLLAVLLVFAGTGCRKRQAMEIYRDTEDMVSESVSAPEWEETEGTVFVDVQGAVKKPGVYELPLGSRVYTALEAAGGLLDNARGERVNQAGVLADGQQIYIPMEGEDQPAADLMQESDERVNINTADAKELTGLPGIGESRAADIIAYREANGGFTAVEDIMQVSGIKDALFEKIKDKIKI